mmetsp:Transcript_12085/g.42031  ORF Transcript_12085/g.42031 Transcript_12085/m.42031 type:complete len:212 (-) Transcript_12085:1182-1817(-)
MCRRIFSPTSCQHEEVSCVKFHFSLRTLFSYASMLVKSPLAPLMASLKRVKISFSFSLVHLSFAMPLSKMKSPLSKLLGLYRSDGLRWCCAPSQKPCSLALVMQTCPQDQAEDVRSFQKGSSFHAGTTTTNSISPCDASRSLSIFFTIASISSGTKGGFASNLPSAGQKAGEKKEPRLPKGVSVSSKAEQNLSYLQFKGEAKHSKLHSSCW